VGRFGILVAGRGQGDSIPVHQEANVRRLGFGDEDIVLPRPTQAAASRRTT